MLISSAATFYSVKAHDEVLEQWHKVQQEAGSLSLHLPEVKFIEPYGMCALVLFLNHLPSQCLPVHMVLPGWPAGPEPAEAHGAAVGYLARMQFFPAVQQLLDVAPQDVPEHPGRVLDRHVLLEVSIMRSEDAISGMLHKTGDILQNLRYTAPARGHVLEVLSELCSNVLMHSQSDFGAVAAMQTYRDKKGRRFVVMGIGDAGIGVRQSLGANPAMADRLHSDAQALGVAVQPGASRFAVGGHGGGLPRVLDIARRYGGRVSLRSGSGSLIYHGEEHHRRTSVAPPLQGTQLRIALPEAPMRSDEQGDLLAPQPSLT